MKIIILKMHLLLKAMTFASKKAFSGHFSNCTVFIDWLGYFFLLLEYLGKDYDY